MVTPLPTDYPEQVATDNPSDAGANATSYSAVFKMRDVSELSIHLVWAETVATFAGTLTLWASNVPNPNDANDDDWVQQTEDHGWCGLPGGDPTGGSGKDSRDVSQTNMFYYRLKFENTTGEGTWSAYINRKGLG